MAMKVRESGVTTEFKVVSGEFIQASERTKLQDLSLNELADRYVQIDNQAHMMKGLILLEARSRFPSNNEFGGWVKSVVTLCDDGHQVRNRLMRYAKFFKDKDTTGISLTSCYAISSVDDDIAEVIYTKAKGKNLSVDQVKDLIKQAKKEITSKDKIQEQKFDTDKLSDDDIKIYVGTVLSEFSALSDKNVILILQNCIKATREKMKQTRCSTF
jgi:hypothetical protein